MLNVGFDLAFLLLTTEALRPWPLERLRSMMPLYASAISSSSWADNSVPLPPEGTNSPVIGDVVPLLGTCVVSPLCALAGTTPIKLASMTNIEQKANNLFIFIRYSPQSMNSIVCFFDYCLLFKSSIYFA